MSVKGETAMGERIELGLPDKLELYNHGSSIEIVRKWFGWNIVIMTAFALVWDMIIYELYSNTDICKDPMNFYFPLLHVAAGIGMTYYAIAGWFNRTHIQVSNGKIAIFHSPVP